MDWQNGGTYDHSSHGPDVGRCEERHAAGGASSVAKTASMSPLVDEDAHVRDGEYYIDSADCVIRVDNTLFRVSVISSHNAPFFSRRHSTFVVCVPQVDPDADLDTVHPRSPSCGICRGALYYCRSIDIS